MIKKITLLALMLTSLGAFAQIPAGYYDSAVGNGFVLKTQLKEIIDNLNDGLATEYQSIDKGYAYLYTTYQTSDSDNYYENNGTVLDMYTENPTGSDVDEFIHITDKDPGSGGTAEGQYYNREHIIPQSVFNQASPMKNDAHFVVPSDKYINGQRGNFPFGVVENASPAPYTNGTKRGNNLNSGYSAGYTGTVFEPINEFKGDIARMFFYFAVRYQDDIAGFDPYDMFDGTANIVFTQTFFNILYKWHNDDAVSPREIVRNNAIYAEQNNRNPFIDHPEYVEQIWSTTLSTDDFSIADDLNIFPNPVTNNQININSKNLNINTVKLYSISGKLVVNQSIDNNNDNIQINNLEALARGIYLLKIESKSTTIVKKVILN